MLLYMNPSVWWAVQSVSQKARDSELSHLGDKGRKHAGTVDSGVPHGRVGRARHF